VNTNTHSCQYLILMVALYFSATLFSQEITEENYLKEDKKIWETYEHDCADIVESKKSHPEKRDSLNAVLDQLSKIADNQNRDSAIKYASVPSGLKRLYMIRLGLSKDTLFTIYNTLPIEMQESSYGKSLLLHLKTKQIEENDKYFDFDAFDSSGNKFRLSSLEGQTILLLYNGLDCMGSSGREFLNQLYNHTDKETFKIVVYWSCKDLMELQTLKAKFSVNYLFVSDFLDDHSLVKITYGAQARPTCFLIDKDGIVILKSIGLPEERLTALKDQGKL
jgi:hypothetical protein